MTDNSGRYKQGDFVEAKPSKIPLFIILLPGPRGSSGSSADHHRRNELQ